MGAAGGVNAEPFDGLDWAYGGFSRPSTFAVRVAAAA